MKYRALGGSGIQASVVGLGTWVIGGWMWGGADDQESIHAIQAALDAGINLLDTAPVYGFGHSEELVGKAIRGRRDKVVLATKCGLIWNEAKGEFFFASDDKQPTDKGGIKVYRHLSPASIRLEVEQSLKRLGTDRIDLFQTHWQDPTTPIAETMAELMKLKQEGKIRAIGCSNATPAEMDEYRRAGSLDTDQELYSMLDRKPESSHLPYVAKHGMAFLAYSPLAQGLLTGAVGPDRVFEAGDQRNANPRFSVDNRRRIQAMLDQYRVIADRHSISLGQLAIAWTVAQTGCSHALVGARSSRQAVENAKAGGVTLTQDEVQTIRAAIEQHTAGFA
jgi:aryl-alcohol dehydrogenase-like predicted oxidoreductase